MDLPVLQRERHPFHLNRQETMLRRGAHAKVYSDHEQQFEVYVNLISNIANISVTELVLPVDEDGEDREDEDLTTPLTFGTAVHAKAHPMPNEEDANSNTPPVMLRKSVSLLHTEDMIWHLLRKKNEQSKTDKNTFSEAAQRTFGLHLFCSIPASVTCRSQVLEMLSKATETLSFHAIIYHIASIVAFQHYVRLVVLRTGQFAPQRTMNIQTSYQQTLLEGLFQVHLTDPQHAYIRTFDYSTLHSAEE